MSLRSKKTPYEVMVAKRAADQEREDARARILEIEQVGQRSAWENNTAARIRSKAGEQRMQSLQRDANRALNQRRRQLAALFNEEMDSWQQEIRSNVESVDDRKRSLRERATKLREAREATRKAFVTEMLNAQWRDQCDDARSLDSKATLMDVDAKRRSQAGGERDAENAVLAKEEAEYQQAWKAECARLEAVEKAKDDARIQRNTDMRRDLDIQTAYNWERKQNMKKTTRAEDNASIAMWKAEIKADEDLAQQRKEEAWQRGRDVLRFNAERLGMREAAAAKEREQDLILLNMQLEKEASEKAGEDAKRNEEIRITREYQSHLQAQMIKEAEDTSELDELRRQDEARVWNKRDQDQKDQADARAFLLKQVMAGREEQLRLKAERALIDVELDRIQVEDDKRTFQEALDRDAAEARQRVEARQANAVSLKKQIHARERARAREEQEKYLMNRQLEKMERDHKARLDAQAGNVRTYYPLSQVNWYT